MVQPHSRQSFDQVGQRGGNPLADACPALGHDLSVFGQQATQAVDLRGAEFDPLAAHAVQGQHGLLGLGFDRHGPERRLLHRCPDGAGIGRIALPWMECPWGK